jgi:hypothetical protein
MPPGQSTQLSAHAVKNDGTREEVTGRAQWTSSAPAVLGLTGSGMAAAAQAGESLVTARVDALTATARVLVLPTGTYRLSGTASEFGVPLSEVAIEVLEGVGTGLKTTSRADGTYALYGVSGSIRLHLKKEGYLNAMETLAVNAHTTRNLMLETANGQAPYTGIYTMTITAVSPCSGSFPDSARQRVYTAHILQRGSGLNVRLADAQFILTRGYGNGFAGTSAQGRVTFDLTKWDWYYYYYSAPEYQLVEQLSPNMALVVYGYGSGEGSATHVKGRLGRIAITANIAAPHTPFSASCNADFELVKR